MFFLVVMFVQENVSNVLKDDIMKQNVKDNANSSSLVATDVHANVVISSLLINISFVAPK